MSTLIRTGGGGADLSVVTAAASDVLASKVIVNSSGNAITGTIASKAAATITPGATDQTIVAGQYLSGAQTVKGDSDLLATNIKSGVTLFDIVGSFSPIKSVQRGVTAVTYTATSVPVTISSIDPSAAVVTRVGGCNQQWVNGSTHSPTSYAITGTITNATTLTLARPAAATNYLELYIAWEIIEFNGVKSKQSGIITSLYSSGQRSTTITAVNTSKSILMIHGGSIVTANSGMMGSLVFGATLSSSTAILWYGVSGDTKNVAWQVLEFN